MSEMVERVEEAIAAAFDPYFPNAKVQIPLPIKAAARAAIEAMREPTGLMLSHGDAVIPSGFHWAREGRRSGTQDIYRAMIGAALTEK